MTSLTLVRHGTTEWIEQGRLHGRLDSPLSARGRREVELAANALKKQHFDVFYTSPLGRARETAAIIGAAIGMQPVALDGLQEMDFGWLEGGRGFNFANDNRLQRAVRSSWISALAHLTGESRAHFGQRVAETAREIAREHDGQRVLAVIHMAVRSNMLARLVDEDPKAWVRYDGWPAGAFTEIELSTAGKARLVHLSITDHLRTGSQNE
jgi:broad specificity phosphatase PhoE